MPDKLTNFIYSGLHLLKRITVNFINYMKVATETVLCNKQYWDC